MQVVSLVLYFYRKRPSALQHIYSWISFILSYEYASLGPHCGRNTVLIGEYNMPVYSLNSMCSSPVLNVLTSFCFFKTPNRWPNLFCIFHYTLVPANKKYTSQD